MKILFIDKNPDAFYQISWTPDTSTFIRVDTHGAEIDRFTRYGDANRPPTINQAMKFAQSDFDKILCFAHYCVPDY